jgi:hypothetical protein
MVEPGALETCHTKQPSEASKPVRTRAQRIPSRSRALAHTKAGYICADPTPIFTFRLQHGGGPYIPYCRQFGHDRSSERIAALTPQLRVTGTFHLDAVSQQRWVLGGTNCYGVQRDELLRRA